MSTRPFEPDLLVEQPPKPPKRAKKSAPRARAAGGGRAKKRKQPVREAAEEPLLVLDDALAALVAPAAGGSGFDTPGGTVDELQLDPALFALDSLFADCTVPLAASDVATGLLPLPEPPASFYAPSPSAELDIDPELTRLVARLSESASPPDPLFQFDSLAFLPPPPSTAPSASILPPPQTTAPSVAGTAPHSRTASAHTATPAGTPAASAAPSPAAGAPSPAPEEPDPRAGDIPVGSPQRERPARARRAAIKWTAEEDAALLRFKEDRSTGYVVWKEVAERIGVKHTGVQCRARYMLLKDKQKIRSSTEDNLTQGAGKDGQPLALRRRLPFRESDDAVLLSHVIDASLSLKSVDWSAVGQTLDPPRTGDSCYQRARKLKLRREAELAGQAAVAVSTPTPPPPLPPPSSLPMGAVTPAGLPQEEIPPDLYGAMFASRGDELPAQAAAAVSTPTPPPPPPPPSVPLDAYIPGTILQEEVPPDLYGDVLAQALQGNFPIPE
ncbi:hypothetical protein JCM10450v2_003090 [Rhodotorula kratochvilovae]